MPLSEELLERLRESAGTATYVDRYRVVRAAGQGGMGRVYEATERRTGARVAIKVLANLETGHERFVAEVALLERLRHPAIVAYVGHGLTEAGEPYLAMDWLDGEPLSSRLERGALPLADAIAVAQRIAEAAMYFHSEGVVHRDIKPSNVFLVGGQSDRATLIDFGIARDAASPDRLTHSGQLIGTPGYMAPEQAKGQGVDGRADLFALGCLLYSMIAGKPPFEAADTMSVLAQLLLHDPPRIRTLCPEVPHSIDLVVAALLAKDPERRLSRASELADELARIGRALASGDTQLLAVSQLVVPAWEAPTVASSASPPPKRRSRWRWLAAAGAASIAAVIAVVAASSHRSKLVCIHGDTTGCEALCDDGNKAACYTFAVALSDVGSGAGSDLPRAREILGRLCRDGDGGACMTLAMSYRRRSGRASEAGSAANWVPWLQIGCEANRFSPACDVLASSYDDGLDGLPRDPARALQWYERSCSMKGNCIKYADRVRRGLGTAADPERAMQILKDSCARGEGRSCAMIASVRAEPAR